MGLMNHSGDKLTALTGAYHTFRQHATQVWEFHKTQSARLVELTTHTKRDKTLNNAVYYLCASVATALPPHHPILSSELYREISNALKRTKLPFAVGHKRNIGNPEQKWVDITPQQWADGVRWNHATEKELRESVFNEIMTPAIASLILWQPVTTTLDETLDLSHVFNPHLADDIRTIIDATVQEVVATNPTAQATLAATRQAATFIAETYGASDIPADVVLKQPTPPKITRQELDTAMEKHNTLMGIYSNAMRDAEEAIKHCYEAASVLRTQFMDVVRDAGGEEAETLERIPWLVSQRRSLNPLRDIVFSFMEDERSLDEIMEVVLG